MFIAIYRFEIKPGHDSVFINSWKTLTEAIFRHRGSLGSRLHREKEGSYIAYAQWPSQDAFERDVPLPPEAEEAGELMKASCMSRSLLHRLEVVADHLKPEDMVSRPLPYLETERLILRLPNSKDIPEILKYFSENESHLSPFDPRKPEGFYTEAYWEKLLPKQVEAFLKDQAVRLYLFANREVIGTLELSQIARGPFQACYLGYGIGKKYEGRGLMFEGVSAAIRYAFGELKLHRIMANHLPDNERSARLLGRLGFTREGVARDYLQISGVWRDHVLNSLSNPHWGT